MNEELQQKGNIEQQNSVGIDDSKSIEGIVEEKIDWVQKAIEYEATPKSLREPQDKMTFIDDVCKVPRATYYYEINKKETQESIIDLCFKQAKRRTPEVLEKLGKKAEEGDNVSIGQFLEFVLEKKKKIEHSGDKENPIRLSTISELKNGDICKDNSNNEDSESNREN